MNSKIQLCHREKYTAELVVNHNFSVCYLQVYLLLTVASYSHKTKAQLTSAYYKRVD